MRTQLVVVLIVPLISSSVATVSTAQVRDGVIMERRVKPARTSRVMADTLYWILPRPVPLPAPLKGRTDSLKIVFGRDSIYQMVGRRGFALPVALWPLAYNMQQSVADTVAVRTPP